MSKNKQSELFASVKMLNIGFIKKHIINLGIGRGAIHYVITNHLPQNFFHLFLPFPIIFL